MFFIASVDNKEEENEESEEEIDYELQLKSLLNNLNLVSRGSSWFKEIKQSLFLMWSLLYGKGSTPRIGQSRFQNERV